MQAARSKGRGGSTMAVYFQYSGRPELYYSAKMKYEFLFLFEKTFPTKFTKNHIVIYYSNNHK